MAYCKAAWLTVRQLGGDGPVEAAVVTLTDRVL